MIDPPSMHGRLYRRARWTLWGQAACSVVGVAGAALHNGLIYAHVGGVVCAIIGIHAMRKARRMLIHGRRA